MGVTGNINFEDSLNHRQFFVTRYPNFDPETPFQKIGSALNDIQFNFKSKRKAQHMEYWLIEKS